MFKILFGKEKTDKMAQEIVEKSVERTKADISDSVKAFVSKQDKSEYEINKSKYEKDKLKFDDDKLKFDDKKFTEEKEAQKLSTENLKKLSKIEELETKPIFKSLKEGWYKYTSSLRLKVEEKNFKNLLIYHKEYNSPQSIQGMWQAYGSMRAARTAGRYSVLATGFLGGSYALFNALKEQEFAMKEEELERKKADFDIVLETSKHSFDKLSEENPILFELTAGFITRGKMLNELESYLKSICDKSTDKNCYTLYEEKKNAIAETYDDEYNTVRLNSEQVHDKKYTNLNLKNK